MNHISHMEYLAAKDAYLTRLLTIVDCMIEDQERLTDSMKLPTESEVPAGSPIAPTVEMGESFGRSLNANLHPCMLPFEDFVCDVRHTSHPYCD